MELLYVYHFDSRGQLMRTECNPALRGYLSFSPASEGMVSLAVCHKASQRTTVLFNFAMIFFSFLGIFPRDWRQSTRHRCIATRFFARACQ